MNNTPLEWVTCAEAARRLDIHIRTVERRAKDGRFNARTNASGKVEVEVPGIMPTPELSLAISQQAEKGMNLAELLLIQKREELHRMRIAFKVVAGALAACLLLTGAIGYGWVNARERGAVQSGALAVLQEQVGTDRREVARLNALLVDAAWVRQFEQASPYIAAPYTAAK